MALMSPEGGGKAVCLFQDSLMTSVKYSHKWHQRAMITTDITETTVDSSFAWHHVVICYDGI